MRLNRWKSSVRQLVERCGAFLVLGGWMLASSPPIHADEGPGNGISAEDYARAERFLPWNLHRYVVNGDIQTHWVDGQDRFWYLRDNRAGEQQFILVDAITGAQSPAFDQQKIADALSEHVGTRIAAGNLPFSIFRYVDGARGIEFRIADKLWTCSLLEPSCSSAAHHIEPHEMPSPDGRWIAFVQDYNLWIRPVSGGSAFAATTDGREHYSYAGTPGYSTHAVSDKRRGRPRPQALWSPDSRFLLSHRIDERQVKDLFLIQSVPDDGSMRPILHRYRYALPGDTHVPLLSFVVVDVAKRRRVELNGQPLISLPQTPIEKHDIWWEPDSRTLHYLSRDRYSKVLRLNRADPKTGAVAHVLEEACETLVQSNATNIFDAPVVRILSNGDIIWYSQRDGWGHLYYYDQHGRMRHQITRGEWNVRDIVHVDEAGRRIYFTASGLEQSADPYEQRMYRVHFNGTGLRTLTPEAGDHQWSTAMSATSADDALTSPRQLRQFSPSGRYFLDRYSRPDSPPQVVLRSADGRLIAEVERADISKLLESGYVPAEPFEVLAADGRTPIYGNLFRPSNFDPKRRYPVIDSYYPGPQTIRTAKTFTAAMFGYFEAQSLAELGFVVVTLDGRGTPQRSRAFFDHAYGRLDKASDLADHIAGLQQLARRYPYLDLNRVGVDGASAGAYGAARAVLAYPDFYKVAVAAQGNYDQRGYLAPWGETYVGPLEHSDYALSSILPLAANLKGKLLLMHGEMDDNVSPTMTMKLVDALIKANRDFDLLIIPNGDHSAFFTSTYFIRRKWDFFVRHLLQTQPPANYSISAYR